MKQNWFWNFWIWKCQNSFMFWNMPKFDRFINRTRQKPIVILLEGPWKINHVIRMTKIFSQWYWTKRSFSGIQINRIFNIDIDIAFFQKIKIARAICCQFRAIYWYCQYQYWILKKCNINIEILLAIYCQYIDRAIYF